MPLRERGVTLTEVLITLLIVVILLALAIPSYRKNIEENRLVAATEAVFAHLQFARSEGIKLGRATNLRLSIRSGSPWCLGISNATANCNCTAANACRYGPDLDANGSADLERNLLGSDFPNIGFATTVSDVQINSLRGAFPGTDGTITLTSASGLVTKITLSSLGRVRICSPSGTSHVARYSSTSCP